MKLCAARIGQLLNVNALANECDITVPTANSWLSILETSYVVYLLKPYHKNYNKRLIKSPNLYFYDTGLASSLLGLDDVSQLATHYLRGELFENMIISEYLKKVMQKVKNLKYTFGVIQIYSWSNDRYFPEIYRTGYHDARKPIPATMKKIINRSGICICTG